MDINNIALITLRPHKTATLNNQMSACFLRNILPSINNIISLQFAKIIIFSKFINGKAQHLDNK